MAFRRILLQPTIKVSTQGTAQESRFAARVTGWKTVLPWVNVFANSTTTSNPTMRLISATALGLNDDATGQTFWKQMDTVTITFGQVGAYKGAGFVPADYVRWYVDLMTGGTMTLEVWLYCYDV